ncbi:MAG: class I SAM-dependent methyltransferase [Acidobacteriia bacterium]|nr:class I SAM-dependent methyltransferase [Terriglobia bacterium]
MSEKPATPDWNHFGRTQASRLWRAQSGAMGRSVTQAIVDAAQAAPGMRILDVACGSGEPAISLASQLKGSGEVVGIDISEAPLKIAAERAAERGLGNARFQPGDAHALPFPDGSLDLITSRLGVMFFADLHRALGEMHRVLKPGGRVTLLAWGPMEQPYFESTIGTLLRLIPGAQTPESARKMFAFGEPGVLAGALRAAGFKSVQEKFEIVPWTWPGSPEEVWEYFQEVTVPFAPLMKSIPSDRRGEIDAAVIAAIGRFYDGKEIRFTATVNITSAVKY